MKYALLGLLLLSAGAFGQATKTKISFNCTCDDTVGSLYATAFRDLLATSPRYTEVNKAEEKDASGKTVYSWNVMVVSLDPSTGKVGDSSALSVVFLIGDSVYMTSLVQTCISDKVRECAQSTLASLDGLAHGTS